MAGHVRIQHGLVISFTHDDDEAVRPRAKDCGRAAQVACVMIAQLGQLRAGDVMTVTEA